MKQGLFLLSLNQVELEEYLESEIERNPFLTRIPSSFDSSLFEIPDHTSRFNHLMTQAKQMFANKDLSIAEKIIGNLDEKGFFREILITEHEKKILNTIQMFDPVGIAAYNIQESLLIQLSALNKGNSLAYQVVKHFYSELLQKKWDPILDQLHCTRQELFHAVFSEIAHLNFFVGQGFDTFYNPTNIPDLVIEKRKGKYQSLVHDRIAFQIKDPYSSYRSKEVLAWKTQQLRSVSSLIKNLEHRKALLRNIGNILIEHEIDFFEGTDSLQPISIKQASVYCDVHLTTIHRALHTKYVRCPAGTFPLKIFFKKSVKTQAGKEISNQALLHKIQSMIQKENKQKPLSDETLVKNLQLQGIKIARRTLTKYRKALKIPAAFYRKSVV